MYFSVRKGQSFSSSPSQIRIRARKAKQQKKAINLIIFIGKLSVSRVVVSLVSEINYSNSKGDTKKGFEKLLKRNQISGFNNPIIIMRRREKFKVNLHILRARDDDKIWRRKIWIFLWIQFLWENNRCTTHFLLSTTRFIIQKLFLHFFKRFLSRRVVTWKFCDNLRRVQVELKIDFVDK
jgi:hypothetical protein